MNMGQKIEAVYENGHLKLPMPLPLVDHARVEITIDRVRPETADDPERRQWLGESAASLTRIWDNPDDDAYNELLKR